MAKKKFSYDEALRELENILATLNEGKIGIDQLREKVLRAKELLALCKEKLRSTEEEIKELLK